MIKVLLADDHAVVRDGLRVLLQAQSDINVVGDVANGREAVRFVLQQHPDVVVWISHAGVERHRGDAADS
jgi:Response regulator containing CheY-like receiver domain and AraC-type DNA-binding domain